MDTLTKIESAAFTNAVSPILRQVFLAVEIRLAADVLMDDETSSRIEKFARLSNEGNLSQRQRAEYRGYVRANKFLATLFRQLRKIQNSAS